MLEKPIQPPRLVLKPPILKYYIVDPSLQLWQANNAVQRAYHKALRPYGLTYVQFMVLRTLAFDMNRATGSQHRLAKQLYANKVMIGQVLRLLQQKQLVRRQAIETKRNSWRVSARGMLVVREAQEGIAGVEGEVWAAGMQKPGLLAGLRELEPPVII